MCGEHVMPLPAAGARAGSSPRVWGTLGYIAWFIVCLRFIPTCVGNTVRSVYFKMLAKVHPHVCGEHGTNHPRQSGLAGSSPRVWGTPGIDERAIGKYRFIPTCVGNTPGRVMPASSVKVHPHVCGEHIFLKTPASSWAGSSPRVWGTRETRPSRTLANRFIPTCVGNTASQKRAR